MMKTTSRSGAKTETAPTVAVVGGQLVESNPNAPGAITLSTMNEHNQRGSFDPEIIVHYSPDGSSFSDRLKYSVCMAGEMAAHAGNLTITVVRANDGPCSITLKFPEPDHKTIPVGNTGTMVEHPQSFYGGNRNGVEVVFNAEKNSLTYKSASDPVTLGLASFPKLLAAIKQSVGT